MSQKSFLSVQAVWLEVDGDEYHFDFENDHGDYTTGYQGSGPHIIEVYDYNGSPLNFHNMGKEEQEKFESAFIDHIKYLERHSEELEFDMFNCN